LETEFGEGAISKRSVYGILQEYRSASGADSQSGNQWTMASDGFTADDARLILPVLGHVLRRNPPLGAWMTEAKARWVVRVRRAVPDLPVEHVLPVAAAYAYAVDRGESCEHIDRFLALEAWRDDALDMTEVAFQWLLPEWFRRRGIRLK